MRGWMSLHVGTSCAAPAALSLRVVPDRDWLLPFDTPLFVHTAMVTASSSLLPTISVLHKRLSSRRGPEC